MRLMRTEPTTHISLRLGKDSNPRVEIDGQPVPGVWAVDVRASKDGYAMVTLSAYAGSVDIDGSFLRDFDNDGEPELTRLILRGMHGRDEGA